MKKIKVQDLMGALSRKAPTDLAEEWDNVGLLAGDASCEVTGVVVAVNLGPESLEAAKKEKANVIVVHHPPIFKPVYKLTKQSSPWLFEAMKNEINVIAMHTNFDLASKEMNEKIATLLGTRYLEPVASRGGDETPRSILQGKFITYVPEDALEKVREAVCKAGAGVIGEYTNCSFSFTGEGTFKGSNDSQPTVGKAGVLEKTREKRLEVVFRWKSLENVIKAAREAHPYEEMAYDIIRLENTSREIGYGFVSEAPQKLTFRKLVENAKNAFQVTNITIAEPLVWKSKPDEEKQIRKICFSPGVASSFIGAAAAKGVDAYICGEVGYHQILEARTKGVALLILGHSYSERFFVETMSEWCKEAAVGNSVTKVFEIIEVQQ